MAARKKASRQTKKKKSGSKASGSDALTSRTAKKKATKKAATTKAVARQAGQQQTSRKKGPAERTLKSRSDRPAFPVVGIGASAGGLEALEELLDHMPADTGMAFVVVTHQHPGHTSLLPELLSRDTEMPVVAADDGMKLESNHVYIGPPGGHLAILNGTLQRMETEKKKAPHLPIDYFFRSLADDQKEQAICIVLSGTGTDGTLGLRAIKGASGMAMAQEPQSAKYTGMPSSAQATGLADYVLPPADMPQQLLAYANGPYLRRTDDSASAPVVPPEPMQKIFVLLRNRTGHDFSGYKENTIRRRIERRMNVHQITQPDDYVRYLQENPHESDVLFKELLISVTHFFRDPQSWDTLASGPLTELIKSRPDNYTIRAWVPGCATGEEVFTLAIVMRECMHKLKRHFDIQIFGSDLDSEAVDAARVGQYPSGIGVDVSPARLERYFTHDDSVYRIRKEIREMAIFAPQNVIKDPPFTRLDFISCRNLMIYLNADLQQRLLPIFHYALKPGGLLMLGPSETIGRFADLFDTVDKKWKIFRRKETTTAVYSLPRMPASRLPADAGSDADAGRAMPAQTDSGAAPHVSTLVNRLALARFCPAFVVVNDRGDIIHVHGRTGEYLELAEGQVRTNVLDMAREGLTHELASIMRQAVAADGEIVREDVRVRTNGDYTWINLSATRILEPEPIRGLLLIIFRPVPSPAKPTQQQKGRRSQTRPGQLETLERELQIMKESNQTTLEELETSNEELKSTNEELQSTNEEMQSTNEELETSKEEMQSLNEELTTVNAELQCKVDDLSQANDDMQNLLNSTDIATVFLDDELNIKRFTEEAQKIIAIRATDIGRPISELTSQLDYMDLPHDCKEVLDTLVFKKQEVAAADGKWYLMRITPYRTINKVIDGLVLTFVNITDLKAAEKTSELRTYYESIFETVRQPLMVLDQQRLIRSANRCFYQTFRLRPKQVDGTILCNLDGGAWDIPELREVLEEVLPQNSTVDEFKVDHEFPRIGRRVFMLNARRLDQNSSLPGMILLAMEDVTEKFS